MDHASPFGRPLLSTTRVTQEDEEKRENTRRFGQLKPICVELLGQVSSSEKVDKQDHLYKTLKRLEEKLVSFKGLQQSFIPLSPALISYIFYPIAQLLRSSTNLPDRIRISQFTILNLLTDDWWRSWITIKEDNKEKEGFQIWEQLLILSAGALDGGKQVKNDVKQIGHGGQSDECTLAILGLLESLLICRKSLEIKEPTLQHASQTNWEWDGESDLPDLDDYEAEMQRINNTDADTSNGIDKDQSTHIVYPTDLHLDHTYSSKTCQGALAHVLSSLLDQAKLSSKPVKIRYSCLRLANVLLQTWIAGSKSIEESLTKTIQSLKDTDSSSSTREAKHFSLVHQADRLSISLPATVSAIIRICNEPKCHSDVLVQSLSLLKFVLVSCLNDSSTDSKTVSNIQKKDGNATNTAEATLDELIANAHIGETNEKEQEENSAKVMDIDEEVEEENNNETIRSSIWLKDTISRIAFAFQSFNKEMLNSEIASVQCAMSELAGGLLNECYRTLDSSIDPEKIDLIRLLLDWLFEIPSNEKSSKSASKIALQYLVLFLNAYGIHRKDLISHELTDAAQQLPKLLSNPIGQDETIFKVARRIGFLASLSSGGIDANFASLIDLQNLLTSQEYERWLLNVTSSISIDMTTISDLGVVRIYGVDAFTSKIILQSFRDLGASSGRLLLKSIDLSPSVEALRYLEYLLKLSHRWRTSNRQLSVNALLLARQAIAGIAEILDDEKLSLMEGRKVLKVRKFARRFARKVIAQIHEIWQTDEEELLSGEVFNAKQKLTDEERQLIADQQSESDKLTEQIRGAQKMPSSQPHNPETDLQLGPAANVDFVQIATISDNKMKTKIAPNSLSKFQRRKLAIDYAQLGDSLLLEILAEASKIMGPSIKSSFIQLLYPTICAVASANPSVKESAAKTIQIISYSAGYASIEGCLLDHADYILGAASHRLISTLGEELQRRSQFASIQSSSTKMNNLSLLSLSLRDSQNEKGAIYYPLMSALSAPLVLVELIRTLGTEVVVLVEDAIDEVLDAIDRFHGDDDICDGLLAVLDKMVEVMLNNIKDESLKELPSPEVGYQPNKEADLNDFIQWYQSRGKKPKESDEELFDRLGDDDKEGEDASEKEDLSDPNVEETSIGRSQKVTVSMMMKAIPFLSHSSRIIRMRCLRLINRGVELLCRQGLNAEPLSVVNACWPFLMSRIGFNLSKTLKPNAFLKSGLRVEQMDEQDFFVAIEAVKLFTTLVRYLQAFLGTEKMLRQAIPRILLLVTIVEQSEQRSGETMTSSSSQPTKQTTFLLKEIEKSESKTLTKSLTNPSSSFRPFRKGSPLAILVETSLEMLNVLVFAMGASITETDLFSFATHPTFLSALDIRQPEQILKQANQFYHSTIRKRNPALVWWVIQATQSNVDSNQAFPAYLSKPNLRLVQS